MLCDYAVLRKCKWRLSFKSSIIKDLLIWRDLVSKKCISSNWHFYIVQNMSWSGSRIFDPVFKGGGGGSRFSKRKANRLVWATKWCHLWMEWIRVLWTQLLDPTCGAKCSNILHDSSIHTEDYSETELLKHLE